MPGRINLDAWPKDSTKIHDATPFLQYYKQYNKPASWARSGFRTRFGTFEHPLGPALNVTVSALPQVRTRLPFRLDDTTYVFVNHRHTDWIVSIVAMHEDPKSSTPFQSTWDEIVRSIRVMQK